MSKKDLLFSSITLFLATFAGAGEYAAIGDPVALSSPSEYYMAPQWSPDGEQVAASGRSYNHLYLIDFPTGVATQLSDASSAGYGFAWSHDGARIATRLARYENRRRTHTLVSFNVNDGSMATHIPERSRMSGRPIWSSDDSELHLSFSDAPETYALNGQRNANPRSEQLAVIDGKLLYRRAGSSTSKILFADQDRVTSYALAPDGQSIVYSTSGQKLWIVDIEGTTRTSLGKGLTPSWSPDSEWITFMLTEDDGHSMLNSEVYIMARDGSKTINITNTEDQLEMHPKWSPDGSWIVYDTDVQGQLYIQQIAWR